MGNESVALRVQRLRVFETMLGIDEQTATYLHDAGYHTLEDLRCALISELTEAGISLHEAQALKLALYKARTTSSAPHPAEYFSLTSSPDGHYAEPKYTYREPKRRSTLPTIVRDSFSRQTNETLKTMIDSVDISLKTRTRELHGVRTETEEHSLFTDAPGGDTARPVPAPKDIRLLRGALPLASTPPAAKERRLSPIHAAAAVILIALLFGTLALTIASGAISIFVVTGESMEPTLGPGDIIVTHPCTVGDLQIDDIITYTIDGNSVTRRVVEIVYIDDVPTVKTRGDANEAPELYTLGADDITGKLALTIPHAGTAASFASTPLGFFLIILMPLTALTLFESYAAFRSARPR